MINQLILETGKDIYVALVADKLSKKLEGGMLDPSDYRRFALYAKESAPFIAEAYGFINLKIEESPGT